MGEKLSVRIALSVGLVLMQGCIEPADRLELTTVSRQNATRQLVEELTTRLFEPLIFSAPPPAEYTSAEVREDFSVSREDFLRLPTDLYVQRDAARQVCFLLQSSPAARTTLEQYLALLRLAESPGDVPFALLSPFETTRFATAAVRQQTIERDEMRLRLFSLRSMLRLLKLLELKVPANLRQELKTYPILLQAFEDIGQILADAEGFSLDRAFDPQMITDRPELYTDELRQRLRDTVLRVLDVIDEFQKKFIRDLTRLADLLIRYGDQEFLSNDFLGQVQSRMTALARIHEYEITWGESIFATVRFNDVARDRAQVSADLLAGLRAEEQRLAASIPTLSVTAWCQRDLPGLERTLQPPTAAYLDARETYSKQITWSGALLSWLRWVETQQ